MAPRPAPSTVVARSAHAAAVLQIPGRLLLERREHVVHVDLTGGEALPVVRPILLDVGLVQDEWSAPTAGDTLLIDGGVLEGEEGRRLHRFVRDVAPAAKLGDL